MQTGFIPIYAGCRRRVRRRFGRIRVFFSSCSPIAVLLYNAISLARYFSILRVYWLQSNLESRAILKSHSMVHVPIGCYFTFQIPHFPRCNFNASKSLSATSFVVSANRLWLSLRIKDFEKVNADSFRVNASRRHVCREISGNLSNTFFFSYFFSFSRAGIWRLHRSSFNPLRPNSDLSQTSHCNIKGLSVSEVMRIENMITQVKFYCYFNSFSPLLL